MTFQRRRDLLLLSLLVTGDLVALVGSFWAASAARVALNALFERRFTLSITSELFPPLALVVPLWLVTFALTGAYDILGTRKTSSAVAQTLKAASLAMGLQVIGQFFLSRQQYSRSLFLLYWAISLAALVAARLAVLQLARHLKRRGLAGEAVLVVGTGPVAQLVRGKLESRAEARFRFTGFLSDERSTLEELASLRGWVLGSMDKAEEVFNERSVSRVIVADPEAQRDALVPLALTAARLGIAVERVPDLLGLLSARPAVSDLDGLPLMALHPPRFARRDEVVKRGLDLALGGALALLGLPAAALIALAIKMDSRGPVLYRQRRVGRGGKYFTLLKFRSMTVGANELRPELAPGNEAGGHLFKLRRDPRVTRVGAWLRRFSLDELPQLVNVLKGEMSLVGPRPLPTQDVPRELGATPYRLWLERRRSVAPGVTGLWQVSGRSDLAFEQMVRLDLFYVESWSLALDLQILARTLPAILRGAGAY